MNLTFFSCGRFLTPAFLFSLLFFIAVPFCVQAEEAGVDDPSVQAEIVVTATRSPYSLGRVANHVAVIGRADIERSGHADVAALLRNHGPVQVRDSMGNGRDARLALRGFASSANLLVLVDGRKLNNSDLGGQDLTAVSLNDVERIEILEGGAGALFGDQAVGGVINIITRVPVDAGGQMSVTRASYDRESYALNYGRQVGDGWFYRFHSELDRADGYRDDSSLNYENYSGRLGYRYQSDVGSGQVFVESRLSDNESRLTGALTALDMAGDRRQAGSSFNDYAADNRSLRLGVEHRFNDAIQLLASFSDRDEDVLINSSSGFGDAISLQSRRVKNVDPRLLVTLGDWRVTAGVDLERVDYTFDIDFGFGFSGSAHENRKRSEYLQVLYQVTESLHLQGAIRHAHLETEVESSFAGPLADYEQGVTVHQLGAVWRGDFSSSSFLSRMFSEAGSWRLYLNRDETFRFPLADENVDFFGAVNLLDVQKGVAWELGGAVELRQFDGRLALFQQDNRDEIGFDPGLGFFGANTNYDDTRRRGMTVALDWASEQPCLVGGQCSAGLLYTYLDGRFTDGVYQDKRIPNTARELAKFQFNYRRGGLELGSEWLYTGSQTLDLANSAGSTGGYSVVNLVGRYERDRWTLQARMNNITSKEYTELVTFFGT
ncbi:MAG TPA: hypothetical protein DCF62_04600, partial [Porticoccaceae bacterium]|nr:hypothetical protein [Porticoccaceae bacterium]